MDLVVWRRIGFANVLVTKSSTRAVQEYQEAREAANSTPPDTAPDSESVETPSCDEAPTLEPAILSIIATIDHDKPPANNAIVQDFCDALNNLKALVKEVTGGDASGSAPMRGFLMAGVNGAPVLRFRHVVFEEVNEESGEDGSETASDSDECTLENWPVAHPAAAEAKLTMQGKYHSNPLPAYDTKGEIIAPERCKTALPGAIVRISFTLTYWHITGSKSDSSSGSAYNIFNADVKSIRVLSDPPAQALMPKKRRTVHYDPDDGSPRKKIC
ncbi:hypothetical protein BJ165DRAFT_1407106 [Panaeolus papilionaceus]|nr:hypothetical protein BJ165DRAFT_1407106 [Panaeolus papilionaceus]